MNILIVFLKQIHIYIYIENSGTEQATKYYLRFVWANVALLRPWNDLGCLIEKIIALENLIKKLTKLSY